MLPFLLNQMQRPNGKSALVEDYFNAQYPDTENCFLLDAQIGLIGKDLASVYDKNYFQRSNDDNTIVYQAYSSEARNNSAKFLAKLRLAKENKFASFDCRNQIETKRLNESASTFNAQAGKSDATVISQTRNKQIAYAVAGGFILLSGIILLLKRKK